MLNDRRTRLNLNRALRARGVPAKACSKCFTIKGYGAFPPNKATADGRCSHCNACHAARRSARRAADPSVAERDSQRDRALWASGRAPKQAQRHRDSEGFRAYTSAHHRVKYLHGPASYHDCAMCGRPAQEWMLNNAHPSVQRSDHFTWSDDVTAYSPACKPCHRQRDVRDRAVGLL